MDVTVKEFESRFTEVFGKKVWEHFQTFQRNPYQKKIGFQSFEEIENHIESYVLNIDNVKNFYRQNKQFLRFILICVERAKRPESRIHDYAELYNGIGDEMKWEVEHIFSLHSFNEVFSDPRIRKYQKII